MKFLVKISAFCEPQESREEQRKQLLRSLQNEYCDSVSCPDAYLATDYCTEDNFIFGADDPQTIKREAARWNQKINDRLHRAIEAFQRSERNTTLYDLKKAVMAADDDLYTFADEAVLIPDRSTGTYWLHPKLYVDQYAQVMQHPEDFAIVEVVAK